MRHVSGGRFCQTAAHFAPLRFPAPQHSRHTPADNEDTARLKKNNKNNRKWQNKLALLQKPKNGYQKQWKRIPGTAVSWPSGHYSCRKAGIVQEERCSPTRAESHWSEHLHVSFRRHSLHINSAWKGQKPPHASVKTLLRIREVSNFGILVNELV